MRVAIHTLGCKTNQYESELIRESFQQGDDLVVDFREKADIYIINSCIVTLRAEAETRKMISEAFSRNPEAKVVLTGCAASINNNYSRKNVLIYNGRKSELRRFIKGIKPAEADINSEQISAFSEHTRAVLKVEEGCDNFCSYCIVPVAKGHIVRSKNIKKVLEETQRLVDKGYREIVLTGTEIGKYGEDTQESLPALVKELKKVEGLKRLRISSIHPKHVSDALIEQIEPPVVPHLHISLQSGDNKVLELMRRGYTREDFLKIVEKLRRKDPRFSISTDIIVGFPGETEEAFFNSIYMVREVQFSKVHIFRFSKRPYTPAYFMEETSSESQKKVRSERLKDIVDAVQQEYKMLFLGESVEVLVESSEKELEGFTPHYLKVKFIGKAEPGSIVNVRVEKADSEYLYGKQV